MILWANYTIKTLYVHNSAKNEHISVFLGSKLLNFPLAIALGMSENRQVITGMSGQKFVIAEPNQTAKLDYQNRIQPNQTNKSIVEIRTQPNKNGHLRQIDGWHGMAGHD